MIAFSRAGCYFVLMRRLIHFVVLIAFVFSCGGQWYALQCIAWVKMLHDYSQVVPFTEAVSMTFSGHYPCEICKALAEKKQADDDKICSLDKLDKKFFPPLEARVSVPSIAPVEHDKYVRFLLSRSESPPTPPPRLA